MEGGSRQERLIQSRAGGLIAWELLLLRRAMRFVRVAARRVLPLVVPPPLVVDVRDNSSSLRRWDR
jgi:hypothetical protein